MPKDVRRKLPRLTYTRPLIVPLIGASAFSIIFALIWKDLGLNLVADAASLWFTLFVVEVALEKGRDEVRRPVRQAMAHDLIRLRMPIIHVLSLLLWDTATASDLTALRAVAKGDGDIAPILARRRLTQSPAPMRQLGWLNQPQLTWWQAINAALSPQSLRLEVLIARYVSIAEARTLAALQGLEVSLFMDVLRGQLAFDDDIILEIFWRSLIQSLAALDAELELLLTDPDGPGAVLGPGTYIDFAVGQIEKGNPLQIA